MSSTRSVYTINTNNTVSENQPDIITTIVAPTSSDNEEQYSYSTPSKRPRPYETRTPAPKRIATEDDFQKRISARRLY